MKIVRSLAGSFLFWLVLWLGVSQPGLAGQDVTLGQKAMLQAVMQRHIDRHLVDGVYLQVDFGTGAVRRLHPVAAHPTILGLEKNFVLCTDFRDDEGRLVNIDFYLAPARETYIVFQTVVDNRAPLEALIKRGTAKIVN